MYIVKSVAVLFEKKAPAEVGFWGAFCLDFNLLSGLENDLPCGKESQRTDNTDRHHQHESKDEPLKRRHPQEAPGLPARITG